MSPFVCVSYFCSISPNHICNAHKIGIKKLGILWEQHWYYKTSYINRKENIARIANAVQVTIYLLVSTSVYQCLLVSTSVY